MLICVDGKEFDYCVLFFVDGVCFFVVFNFVGLVVDDDGVVVVVCGCGFLWWICLDFDDGKLLLC